MERERREKRYELWVKEFACQALNSKREKEFHVVFSLTVLLTVKYSNILFRKSILYSESSDSVMLRTSKLRSAKTEKSQG